MAGRLYRMAKVVSANPKSWGIVDANEISGFKRVAKLSDLYSIAECILSSSYGDGVTDGADAVGQIWHVSETNGDYKLTNWASRKSAAGWTKLSYGGDVSVPVKDVQVDGTTVLSNGVANIEISNKYAQLTVTDKLEKNIISNTQNITKNLAQINSITKRIGAKKVDNKSGIAELDEQGYVPLEQLGNLDTVLFEVVTDLPNALNKIKKHIYLKTAGIAGDENVYAEYIYTGGVDPTKDTYDATKWEKLGEVAAKTDLSEYYKKTEVDSKLTGLARTLTSQDVENFTITPSSRGEQGGGKLYYMQASIARKGGDPLSATIPCVVSAVDAINANAGLMSPADKQKLDGIAANANNYTHPTRSADASGSEGLYKITVDDLGHVTKTTAVDKNDITALGIPGSAPTVDAAMSETSTNAVQNKVIDSAIKTHKIDGNNLTGKQETDGIEYFILGQGDTGDGKVSALTDTLTYQYNPSTHSSLSIDGSDVWDASTLTALTDTELTKILV